MLAFRSGGILYSADSDSRNNNLAPTATKLEAVDCPEDTKHLWCLILAGSQDVLSLYHMNCKLMVRPNIHCKKAVICTFILYSKRCPRAYLNARKI